MSMNDATKRIATYLVLVFGVSIPLYGLVIRGGGLSGPGGLYVLPLMWAPALAGLLTTFIFQRNLRGMGWGFGKPIYYLIAYLLPILYAGVVYGLAWLLGLGRLDPSGVEGPVGPFIISALTIHILEAGLLALGEEIGWRGVLVPQLARVQPFARTAVISGVIWGLWHVPLISGGGGYTSGAPAWYAVACFLVHIVGVSFAFAWLRLASGSIWPAVLLHATHNAFIQGVLDKLTADTGPTEYVTTEFGLGLALIGVVVGLVFWKLGGSLASAPRAIRS
ncbi:MAG: CPBP family intramembrane metalloprotease [Chloroflexales bacterium]|nr:CPBP family intramembrane metalloprotease [Chloroflexales bacterium]